MIETFNNFNSSSIINKKKINKNYKKYSIKYSPEKLK